jgi:hypothetical protein
MKREERRRQLCKDGGARGGRRQGHLVRAERPSNPGVRSLAKIAGTTGIGREKVSDVRRSGAPHRGERQAQSSSAGGVLLLLILAVEGVALWYLFIR